MSRFKVALYFVILLEIFFGFRYSWGQKQFLTSEKKWSFFEYTPTDTSSLQSNVYPFIVNYFQVEYSGNSILQRHHLIQLLDKNFGFRINPIFQAEYASQQNVFQSGMGIQFSGYLSKYITAGIKLYTYRGMIPEFARARSDTLPFLPEFGEFTKVNNMFRTRQMDWYVALQPLPYLNISAGKGDHFIGKGYRSLFLSDHAPSYPFVKSQLQLKRIEYLFLLSFLENSSPTGFESVKADNKYTSTHYLRFNVHPNVRLGLFETVIWAADDSVVNRGLDVNYLNPVIFFRPVEFSIGSPDNVLLGLSADIDLGEKIQLYGQFLLDEYNRHYATTTYKWWGNKYGCQIGFSFKNDNHLSKYRLYSEFNQIRPFTYSHFYASKSYGHQLHPLAHPLGSNFKELVSGIQIKKDRYLIDQTLFIQAYGEDSTATNYGNDVFKSNVSRSLENGSIMLQGIQNKIIMNRLAVHYLLHPGWNTYASIEYVVRHESSVNTEHFIFFGIRTSLFKHDIFDGRY